MCVRKGSFEIVHGTIELFIKALWWLEQSFSARVSSNLRCYTNAGSADMHLIHGAFHENAVTAQRMYMERFRSNSLLNPRKFERYLENFYASKLFYGSRSDTGSVRYRRIFAMKGYEFLCIFAMKSLLYYPQQRKVLQKLEHG